MQKPHLLSLPNLLTLLILGLSVFRASFFKATKSFGGDSYNDWYFDIFCVQNIEFTKAIADQVQCSDIANFASGIVFGLGKFTAEFKNDYKSLGLIHLIVASGTQVNYLFGAVDWIMIQLGVIKKIRFIFFIISCFTLFSLIGYTPPLVRASIFIFIIVSLTTFFGRYINSFRALIYTFSLILIFNPQWLYYFSFWLSALASLAIIISSEFKNDYLPQLLQDNLMVTLLLLPILSQFNSNLNLITIPLNIILAIVIPYIIGILLFCFIPIIGNVFKLLSVFGLTLIIGIISSVNDITSPYFTIHINKLYQQDILIYYCLLTLIFIILYSFKTNKTNWRATRTTRQLQE